MQPTSKAPKYFRLPSGRVEQLSPVGNLTNVNSPEAEATMTAGRGLQVRISHAEIGKQQHA